MCCCRNACLLRLWHLASSLLRFLLLPNVLLVKEELLCFETGSLYLAQTGSESKRSTCLCFLSALVKGCHSIQAELVKRLPAPFKYTEVRNGFTCGTAKSCGPIKRQRLLPFLRDLYALSNCLFCRQQVMLLVSVVISLLLLVMHSTLILRLPFAIHTLLNTRCLQNSQNKEKKNLHIFQHT